MKAVIPAAGLGTRFLPATKAQPKEMLPVVDKPTIQYVIEEAVASGIEDILIVTGRGKRAIEDHFDRSIELESHLEKSNKHSHLEELIELAELAQIHYIRQKEPKGLGHAVLCARNHVGKQSFAVLLGDVITLSDPPCIKILWDIHEKYKASVIAVEEVPREKVSLYGIVDYEPVSDNLYKVKDIVEKPSLEEAPSQIATLGRYVLTPTIFKILEKTPPGLNNEIQLTDALRALIKEEPLYAYHFKGARYDIGNKLSWLIANIEIALEREDLKEGLKKYLERIFEKS